MSRPTIRVLDSGVRSNLVRTPFLPVKWRDGIRPIYNMSLKSSWNNPVNVIVKIMLFVQLGDLNVRVDCGVVDNLAVPLIETSFMERFVKAIFPIERHIVPIWV